jgi:hypothetical protein
MFAGWNRALSLGAYFCAIGLIWRARGGESARIFASTQLFVLVFIWFADYFSGWMGPFPLPGGRGKVIDQESPAWLIAAFGWLILIGVFAATYFYA